VGVLPLLREMIREEPVHQHTHLAPVGEQFDRRYARIPGLLYTLLQRVTLQNINLIEISSTYTEIVFYVDEHDTRTVFDTLFQSFPAAADNVI
jgi:aspartokinase